MGLLLLSANAGY